MGLRGKERVAALCSREGIRQSLYYKWSKDFLEVDKAHLIGDTKRQASSRKVGKLRQQNEQLKRSVAKLALKNRMLKKAGLARKTSGTNDARSQAKRMEII